MFTPNLHLFYLVFSAYISLHTALLKESILCICWQCFIVWNQQNNSLCKTPYPYPKSRSSLTCTVQPPLAFFFWKRQVLVVILKPTFPFAFVLEIHLLQKKQFFLLREFIYNLCNLRCAGSQAFSYIVSYCNFFPLFFIHTVPYRWWRIGPTTASYEKSKCQSNKWKRAINKSNLISR